MKTPWNVRRVAACCLFAAASAWSWVATAQVAADAARKPLITPELRQHMLHAAQLRSAAEAQPDRRVIDKTPPTITAFDASTIPVNAKSTTAYLPIKVHITDDLSGVAYYLVQAMSPSGQYVTVSGGPAYPSTDLSTTLQLRVSTFAEPGTWQILYMVAQDLAGNVTSLDGAQLAALGNATFTVRNTAYDIVAPTFIRGKVLTPTISLSKPAIGVPANTYTQLPAVAVEVADTGNGSVSGIASSSMAFCLPDGSGGCLDTIYVQDGGYAGELAIGPASTTLTLSESTYAGSNVHLTGTYEISSLTVVDVAGNVGVYVSTAFGGTTDFGTLFPTTTLQVTP